MWETKLYSKCQMESYNFQLVKHRSKARSGNTLQEELAVNFTEMDNCECARIAVRKPLIKTKNALL